MSDCHCGFKIGHPSFSECICQPDKESPIPEGYVILCKSCGEDLGYIFDEHPKVTSHEELTAITKEWVYVQRT